MQAQREREIEAAIVDELARLEGEAFAVGRWRDTAQRMSAALRET